MVPQTFLIFLFSNFQTNSANHGRGVKYGVAFLLTYILAYLLFTYFIGDVEQAGQQNATIEGYPMATGPVVGLAKEDGSEVDQEDLKVDIPVYEYPRTDDEEVVLTVNQTNRRSGTHGYIINTYYYPRSRSFGKNGLAMLMLLNKNTMQEITNYKMTLLVSNATSSIEVIPRLSK